MERNTASPSGFKRILLTLAREPMHPIGDRGVGYQLVAPLDRRSHIDASQWRAHRALYRVIRFRRNEAQRIGHLVRRRGRAWALEFDSPGHDEDSGGCHFGDCAFKPGDRVTITEAGVQHPYEVLTVSDLPVQHGAAE